MTKDFVQAIPAIREEMRALAKQEQRWPEHVQVGEWVLEWVLGEGPSLSETLRITANGVSRLDQRGTDKAVRHLRPRV